jgi:hypothetical protein
MIEIKSHHRFEDHLGFIEFDTLIVHVFAENSATFLRTLFIDV